jgi:5-methylcytosine-specific restriction endonuclease McrA
MAKNKNKKHRYNVYVRNNFTCVYCGLFFKTPNNWDKKSAIHNGIMFLEIDHIIPLSKGGSDDIENKQCLCQKCNNRKSNKIKETEVING